MIKVLHRMTLTSFHTDYLNSKSQTIQLQLFQLSCKFQNRFSRSSLLFETILNKYFICYSSLLFETISNKYFICYLIYMKKELHRKTLTSFHTDYLNSKSQTIQLQLFQLSCNFQNRFSRSSLLFETILNKYFICYLIYMIKVLHRKTLTSFHTDYLNSKSQTIQLQLLQLSCNFQNRFSRSSLLFETISNKYFICYLIYMKKVLHRKTLTSFHTDYLNSKSQTIQLQLFKLSCNFQNRFSRSSLLFETILNKYFICYLIYMIKVLHRKTLTSFHTDYINSKSQTIQLQLFQLSCNFQNRFSRSSLLFETILNKYFICYLIYMIKVLHRKTLTSFHTDYLNSKSQTIQLQLLQLSCNFQNRFSRSSLLFETISNKYFICYLIYMKKVLHRKTLTSFHTDYLNSKSQTIQLQIFQLSCNFQNRFSRSSLLFETILNKYFICYLIYMIKVLHRKTLTSFHTDYLNSKSQTIQLQLLQLSCNFQNRFSRSNLLFETISNKYFICYLIYMKKVLHRKTLTSFHTDYLNSKSQTIQLQLFQLSCNFPNRFSRSSLLFETILNKYFIQYMI